MKVLFRRFIKYCLSSMPIYNSKQPIVVVLGGTGTGKSKLALEIASKHNGEIISADSMQIYKGLDIVTNKVTPEERALVPHHMLDFFDPLETYNVVDFRNATLPIIHKLHEEGKLPVIVGGTHYYVESILWNVLIQADSEIKFSDRATSDKKGRDLLINYFNKKESEKSEGNEVDLQKEKLCEVVINAYNDAECCKSESKSPNSSVDNSVSDEKSASECDQSLTSEIKKEYPVKSLDNLSNEQLLKMLEDIDPDIASTYHPNNRRKILRSLEVWAATGVRHSEHLRRQSAEVGVADLGGSIRFENVAILWVTCDQHTLDARLDGRVDTMMKEGLLQELDSFHTSVNAPLLARLKKRRRQERINDSTPPIQKGPVEEHYTKGIFQSIGFKEFHDYLLLQQHERDTETGRALYNEGIQKMKLRTRQYSRRQIRWIRNRFFLRDRMKIPVYGVDATDPSRWEETVSPIAREVVTSIMEGRTPKTPPVTVETKIPNAVKGDKSKHICDVCNRVFIGKFQYDDHLQSAKHRKVLKRKSVMDRKEEKKFQKS